jgi:membrane protein
MQFTRAAAAVGFTRMAAALTYHVVLAIFPALTVAAGLLGAVGLSPQDVDVLLDAVASVGPDWAVGLVQGALSGVLSAAGTSIALGAGALLALWSASSYVSAFLWATERMEGRRPRSLLRQLPARLGLALLLILLLTACGAAIVLCGPSPAARRVSAGWLDLAQPAAPAPTDWVAWCSCSAFSSS